ncbi:MAG: hypothetical protein GQE15_23835 [Archangiaceae bacterium]|nr:hypothetical protein [Archangiaceae bacterium]
MVLSDVLAANPNLTTSAVVNVLLAELAGEPETDKPGGAQRCARGESESDHLGGRQRCARGRKRI